jgi:hypothetical protein
VKPIRHRIQTTFVVGLEHWIVVRRASAGGWEVVEISEHTCHVDSTHVWRRAAEVVACATAVVRTFNTLTAEENQP